MHTLKLHPPGPLTRWCPSGVHGGKQNCLSRPRRESLIGTSAEWLPVSIWGLTRNEQLTYSIAVAEAVHTTIMQPPDAAAAPMQLATSSASHLHHSQQAQQQPQMASAQRAQLTPHGEDESQHAQSASHGGHQSQQGPQPQQQAQQVVKAQPGVGQGVTVGGVLRRPKLVGIGHMCRAINELMGGGNILFSSHFD